MWVLERKRSWITCLFQAIQSILHQGEKDNITHLDAKTQYGRPEWSKIFKNIGEKHKGWVTVLGSSGVGCNSELKCEQQLTEMSTTVNWNVKQKSYGNQELVADIAVLRY